MSWDYERVLAAVADAERDQADDTPEPGPLAGSDYERVLLASRRAEARLGIAADGPALPTHAEMQAERQHRARERYDAENPEPARDDPNLAEWQKKAERERRAERELFRDDVTERQP